MKLSVFFMTDYVNQASYDNIRKISSFIDGQKNASRKILYTVIEKNIKDEIKVNQLNSKMSEFADYLHGSAESVIVNLAQDFVGTNNLPLLAREGNFGTRFTQEAAASRYIFTYGSENLWNLFNKEDNDILIGQTFEGAKIEPRFYLPTLPLILINGSEGISSGFAQKILNRNPKNIARYIYEYLNNEHRPKKEKSLTPYYEGFSGTICSGENTLQWLIKGSVEKIGQNKVQINELPVGYDLKGYMYVLKNLKDSGAISSYEDKSENDIFKFIVTINSKDLKNMDDEAILNRLKLIKKVSENFTCINEHNKIQEFSSAKEILDRFIEIKLEYTEKRRLKIIEKLSEELKIMKSKYLFIKGILDDAIIINKKSKKEIIEQLEKIKDIVTHNDSYDYLLNMSIHSLSQETFDRLIKETKDKKQKLDFYVNTTNIDMYKSELENFK